MNFRPYSPFSFSNLPPVTKNVIIINFLLFFFTILLQRAQGINLYDYLSLHHHLSINFKPHQIVTYIFMHANLGHIISNMLGVLIFGQMLEIYLGSKRFLIFYLVCGLGCVIPQYIITHIEMMNLLEYKNTLFASGELDATTKAQVIEQVYFQINNSKLLGASGALFGILGGATYIYGNMEMGLMFLPIRIKLKYLTTIYMLSELFAGVSGIKDGIAHYAHIGGLIVGLIFIMFFKHKSYN